MRLREFRNAVAHEFGERGAALTADLVIGELGDRTANEALDRGIDAGEVWAALCRVAGVPVDRWHGVGLRDPKD